MDKLSNATAGIGAVGVAGTAAVASAGTTAASIGTMTTMNAEQDAMAMASMKFQALAATRAMMLQCVRDLCKDAKDTVRPGSFFGGEHEGTTTLAQGWSTFAQRRAFQRFKFPEADASARVA